MIPTPKEHNDKQEEPVSDRDRVRERQIVGVSLRTGKNLGIRTVMPARKKGGMYSRP